MEVVDLSHLRPHGLEEPILVDDQAGGWIQGLLLGLGIPLHLVKPLQSSEEVIHSLKAWLLFGYQDGDFPRVGAAAAEAELALEILLRADEICSHSFVTGAVAAAGDGDFVAVGQAVELAEHLTHEGIIDRVLVEAVAGFLRSPGGFDLGECELVVDDRVKAQLAGEAAKQVENAEADFGQVVLGVEGEGGLLSPGLNDSVPAKRGSASIFCRSSVSAAARAGGSSTSSLPRMKKREQP